MWFAQTAEPTLYGVPVTTDTTSAGLTAGLLLMWLIFVLAVYVLVIVSYWKLFVKAGEAGWKAIVPFYNMYTYFRIAGRNGWGFLLLLVPIVNVIVSVMIAIDIAKHFGKDALYGVALLWVIAPVGQLILGFGDATYVGSKHD